jgi:ribosome-binding ATPase YchF (GTP1/OBG family)
MAGLYPAFGPGLFIEAKAQGVLRTEGKEYIIKDGDVVEFKI